MSVAEENPEVKSGGPVDRRRRRWSETQKRRIVAEIDWRVAAFDRRRQRRKGQPGIDPPAERVGQDAARPRIHDRRQVDEAAEDRDVGPP